MDPDARGEDDLRAVGGNPAVKIMADDSHHSADGQKRDRQRKKRLQNRKGEDVKADVVAEFGVLLPERRAVKPQDVGAPLAAELSPEDDSQGERNEEAGQPRMRLYLLAILVYSLSNGRFFPCSGDDVVDEGRQAHKECSQCAEGDGPPPLGPEDLGGFQLGIPLHIGPHIGEDHEAGQENGKDDEGRHENADRPASAAVLGGTGVNACSGQLRLTCFDSAVGRPRYFKISRCAAIFPDARGLRRPIRPETALFDASKETPDSVGFPGSAAPCCREGAARLG